MSGDKPGKPPGGNTNRTKKPQRVAKAPKKVKKSKVKK